jgi:hypothetical protein
VLAPPAGLGPAHPSAQCCTNGGRGRSHQRRRCCHRPGTQAAARARGFWPSDHSCLACRPAGGICFHPTGIEPLETLPRSIRAAHPLEQPSIVFAGGHMHGGGRKELCRAGRIAPWRRWASVRQRQRACANGLPSFASSATPSATNLRARSLPASKTSSPSPPSSACPWPGSSFSSAPPAGAAPAPLAPHPALCPAKYLSWLFGIRQAPSTSTALPVAPLRHRTCEIKNQVHATRPPASAPPIVHRALHLCLDCFYTCTLHLALTPLTALTPASAQFFFER